MNVLVVAAHPDDEVLGCGATLARHVEEGARVGVIFMTDGVGARGGAGPDAESRRKASEAALARLGAEHAWRYAFPDNMLDAVPSLEIVRVVEAVARSFEPSIVYTHHGNDLNVDHRVVHRATVTAFRPLPSARWRGLFAFETPSSTEWEPGGESPFRPDRFVDVSGHMPAKLAALAAYEDEMRPFPHPRSHEAIEALARWRGASAGLAAAEAFATIRWIER